MCLGSISNLSICENNFRWYKKHKECERRDLNPGSELGKLK